MGVICGLCLGTPFVFAALFSGVELSGSDGSDMFEAASAAGGSADCSLRGQGAGRGRRAAGRGAAPRLAEVAHGPHQGVAARSKPLPAGLPPRPPPPPPPPRAPPLRPPLVASRATTSDPNALGRWMVVRQHRPPLRPAPSPPLGTRRHCCADTCPTRPIQKKRRATAAGGGKAP